MRTRSVFSLGAVAVLVGGIAACTSTSNTEDCGPPSFHNIQYTWCSRAFECRADSPAEAFRDIGASVVECSNDMNLPFITMLYGALGGQSMADQLIVGNGDRFEDCLTQLARMSCAEAAAIERLFADGGYCDSAVLKGESSALPRLEMCDNDGS
jgi:hypothetical protein